jgi:hypothetical protein
MRRPRIRRTVQRQLSLLIPRRHTTTSHRLHLLKEIIHRLRLEPILRAKVSMTVHGMTADLAVVADEVAVTAAAIAEEAGSVVEAGAIAEAAHRDEICRHQNMRRHRVRRVHLIRRIHLRDHSLREIVRTISRQRPIIFRQLFCPVNRLRNIRSGRQ